MHHHPQIKPITKKGHLDAGVLLIHGFTGTPDSMRYLANHLHALGFTVSAPLLAGHGTTRENLAATTWKDWYQTCVDALHSLQQDHVHVFVAGMSLGGILTLKLAEDHGPSLTAMACLATPIRLGALANTAVPLIANTPLRTIYRYQKKAAPDVKDPVAAKNYWSINDMPITCINSLMKLQGVVRSGLSKIQIPTLLMHSRYDSTAPFDSMNEIAKNISSTVTETIALENSYHLITIDYEKHIVNKRVGDFFLRHLPHQNKK